MNLINFHKSTVIKITLEHQKNLIHKDIKKYANEKTTIKIRYLPIFENRQ